MRKLTPSSPPPAAKASRRPLGSRRRAVHAVARTQARDVYRTSILEAAERAFTRRGWASTKIADIAREAGLAAGTLYNYFESKEQILESLIEWRGGQVVEKITAIAHGAGTPLSRLREYTSWMLHHLETDGIAVRIYAEARSGLPLKPAQRCCSDNYQRHLDISRELIAEAQAARELRVDVDTEDLVMALAGIIGGHINAWLQTPTKGALAQRVNRIYDLFLKGAASR
jgi:TetR/AcrR family fatty acid metabolism transcriptional regulator